MGGINTLYADRKSLPKSISGTAVYELRPTDVKTALARLVLKSVTVRDGIPFIEVGL